MGKKKNQTKKSTETTAVPGESTKRASETPRVRVHLQPGDYYVRQAVTYLPEGAEHYTVFGVVIGPGSEDGPLWYRANWVTTFEWSEECGDSVDDSHGVTCFDRLITREEYESAVPKYAWRGLR